MRLLRKRQKQSFFNNEGDGTINPLIVDDDENALDNDLNRKGTLALSTQGKANVWDSEGFLSKLSNIQHPTETEIFGNIIAASEEPTII